MMATKSETERKNIFIVGPDSYNIQQFGLLKQHTEYENIDFYPLLTKEEILGKSIASLSELLERAESILRNFSGKVDAIISPWDFPSCFIACYLRNKRGLPGQSLESFFRCEHKFWSRSLQREIASENVPKFCAFDPFSTHFDLDISFPFWLKPVKSFESHLGFLIKDRRDLKSALHDIRKNIHFLGDSFSEAMDLAKLPENISPIRGHFCLAEELISTPQQITVEGFVFKGSVKILGVVDTRKIEGTTCFHSYQYPSLIPIDIKSKVFDITEKVISKMDIYHGPFNIEFFYNPQTQKTSLLEINSRSSQSHSDLFYKVDGAPLFKASVDLYLGKPPSFPFREGAFHCAGKFFIRHLEDGYVRQTPTENEIMMVKRFFPEVNIQIEAKSGELLSEQMFQDSYSYNLATLHIGGDDRFELALKFEQIKEILSFQVEEVGEYAREYSVR